MGRGVVVGGSVRMRALLLLLAAGAGGSTLRHLSSYDYDPAAQRGWLTLGKTDNLTLLAEGWARYRLPALFELGQNDPSSSLLCLTNGSKHPMIPCGGRGSPTFAANLAALGAALRPHLASGACAGVFLGDELMGAWDLSWADLGYIADGLRHTLGPTALLYENDAFHQGLLDMPHVPSSLNYFSADGDYNFRPFSGPAGIRAAYEQHILPKLAPNQSAWVVPGKIPLESPAFPAIPATRFAAGTYECDGPTMEAPSGSYWACRPGNASYDAHIAGKVAEFAAWAAAEPRISGMCPVRSKTACERCCSLGRVFTPLAGAVCCSGTTTTAARCRGWTTSAAARRPRPRASPSGPPARPPTGERPTEALRRVMSGRAWVGIWQGWCRLRVEFDLTRVGWVLRAGRRGRWRCRRH